MARNLPKQLFRYKFHPECASPPAVFATHVLVRRQTSLCCQRWAQRFYSQSAVDRIQQHNPPQSDGTDAAPLSKPNNICTTTPPRCVTPYRFGDKKYKGFQLLDSDVIYNRLISRCHSMRSLKSSGFVMPQDFSVVTSTIAKEIYVLRKTVCSPASDPLASKPKVILLDCEMVYSNHDTDEAVSICVVDFFTGEVLMNKLVKPHEDIVEDRSKIHGITRKRLNTALRQGRTLNGWRESRKELFTHIDSNTVIIGHGVHTDLGVLRVCHTTVLDTMILTKNAVFGDERLSGRNWSLQALCEELFGLHIRASSKKHSALEDTMAAREIALYCICHPERLQEWAEGAKKTEMAKQALQEKRKVKKMTPPKSSSYSTDGDTPTAEAEISGERK
ncbi:ribonuclease H-like domain-containing protein [Fusarium tricinctum]|uniref:Ribonuclease H-like domain-containing protein n=1 Tax=Fusarium tricinctum TaxID=61284 RepID=A0A8K0W680_9HYPO|nr:ribonuclease H-like domain-containing protein [Fusarium tricinctum]